MRALESMYSKLKSAKIYALNGNTIVDYELMAYAEGLNLAYDMLQELEEESFAVTASSYGISLREQQFGLTAQGGTEQRRAAILSLGAVTPNDFTRTGIQRAMNAAGFCCEICEAIGTEKLYVNSLTQAADTEERDCAIKTAKLFLPAHLNAELDFRSILWNNIDQMDETFDSHDGAELVWDSIDCYENALLQI